MATTALATGFGLIPFGRLPVASSLLPPWCAAGWVCTSGGRRTPSQDAFPEPCPPVPTVPEPLGLRPSSSLPRSTPHAAGIAIGEAEHWVAVPPDRSPAPVRRFGTFPVALAVLADWLLDCGVTTVAMASTGVYWIPLFELF